MYLDAKNLYGQAMRKKLSDAGFMWANNLKINIQVISLKAIMKIVS